MFIRVLKGFSPPILLCLARNWLVGVKESQDVVEEKLKGKQLLA